MEKKETLQDLVRANGSLQEEMARAYIRQVEVQLTDMHRQRHICHGDVRPAMIVISPDGKARLENSSLVHAYSEEGAASDLRDLQAVCQYVLTGVKVEGTKVRGNETTKDEGTKDKGAMELGNEGKKDVSTRDKGAGNVAAWLLGIVGFVMAGSLFWYFFFPKSTPQSIATIGKRQFADFEYEGTLKEGVPHGKGTARYPDGRIYQGQFLDGKRDDEHAHFVYADGNVFEGTFAADTIQQGRVVLNTKDYYFVGSFSHGRPYTGFWYDSSNGKKVEQVINGKEIML